MAETSKETERYKGYKNPKQITGYVPIILFFSTWHFPSEFSMAIANVLLNSDAACCVEQQ